MNLLKELEESRLVNENPDRAAQDCDTKQLGGNSHNLQFALAWVEGKNLLTNMRKLVRKSAYLTNLAEEDPTAILFSQFFSFSGIITVLMKMASKGHRYASNCP